MILDEPSASLDSQAEADLFDDIRKLFAGRTVLLVSHRLSVVRNADRIYLLDGGRVSEQGAHAHFMAADGTFARLFRLQSRSFLDHPTRKADDLNEPGAGDGNRTRVASLEDWGSTIELRPHAPSPGRFP